MMVKKKDKDVHLKENWHSNAIKLKFLKIMLAPPPKKINTWNKIDLLHGHLAVINYILSRIPFFIWTLGMLGGV